VATTTGDGGVASFSIRQPAAPRKRGAARHLVPFDALTDEPDRDEIERCAIGYLMGPRT
jgi:hypothetical protein